jgi:Zn-dependent peptidase ImmA (M78 family)
MTGTRTGLAAAAFADLARAALCQVPTEQQELLRVAPEDTLRAHFGLTVQDGPVQATSACSVEGRYDEAAGRIIIAPGAHVRRRTFTLLHELGHHFAYQIDAVADFLEAQATEDAEEDFADAFAAALLLPDALIERHITPGGPTAADVSALFTDPDCRASREACAVAAMQRLPGSGYVVVADLDGTVRFAARSRTPYRVSRGTPQPRDSILARAGRVGRARSDTAILRYRTGNATDPHAGDAARQGGYVFGVFTTGRPPWTGALWIPADDRPSGTQAVCSHPACGHEWHAVGRACPDCREHRCPACNRCGCNTPQLPK